MKGIIACDIDGTLVVGLEPMAPGILEILRECFQKGWKILFVTGRPFSKAWDTLKALDFPYLLAIQNGALVLQLPSREIVYRSYISNSLIPSLEKVFDHTSTDVVIYGGFEEKDRCYYRPHHFNENQLNYLLKRSVAFGEEWIPLSSFTELPQPDFASAKGFGSKELLAEISQKLESKLSLHAPVIKDPYCLDFYVAQATHPKVSKATALKVASELFNSDIVIACGDDYNDLPMLKAADLAVVMETAPEDVLREADIIAPSASQRGIIFGLKQALERVEN